MIPSMRDVSFLMPQGFVSLAYLEWGPGGGRPVICAHGLTRNARDFDALAGALSAAGRRVIAVDFPGRGRSAWLARGADYAYPIYLGALTALIARLDASEVDWIGTSLGGLAGLMLAAQPKTPIARLIVNDIGPFIPKAALERIASYVGQRMRFGTLAELEAQLRNVAAPFGPLSDAQWRHLAFHSAVADADGYRLHYDPAIAEAFRTTPPADVDLWQLWDRITCPTLVLRGADSDLLLRETAEQMTVRGPRARLVEIAGCGHAPALMASDQIATIAAFLGESDRC